VSSTVLTSPRARAELLADAPTAVEVERLSKTFRLPHHRYSTFKERALHPLRSRTFDELRAVDDISFTVRKGEFFGIVGRNGSGKSTLLKCLAGIYTADQGHTLVHGRLSPFIELGVGFNPELTARENVFINAIMLGLTRKQAAERFDEIIAFAELEDFLDLKLKNYSSGMSVRLAFSVAVQVDAEVLLVDEVLAVGDAAFQQKCFQQFHRMRDAGRTIVFVTHDMSAVERFCDRAVLMERGRVVTLDAPRVIARAYNEMNFNRMPQGDADGVRAGDHKVAEIVGAWFEGPGGERVATLPQDTEMMLCAEFAFHEAIENPLIGFHLRNEAHQNVVISTSYGEGLATGAFAPGDRLIARSVIAGILAPGRYDLTPTISSDLSGIHVLDLRENLTSIMLHGSRRTGAILEMSSPFTLERA
jgi:ABC-type polysaccharide/polyol phosphate transport system ATPase subunit